MFVFLLHRAATAFAESLRVTHCAHAALTIGHDWPLIIHGSVPASSLFATYVLADTINHFAKRASQTLQTRRAPLANEAADAAAPTPVRPEDRAPAEDPIAAAVAPPTGAQLPAAGSTPRCKV